MDIGDSRMEKVDLAYIKALAHDICSMYFSEQKDCEERAEEAILEATNYVSDDPIKYFVTMMIVPLRYYGKTKNLFNTLLLKDEASMFGLEMISRLSEFPYEHSLTDLSYTLCENLSNDPRRCINSMGYLTLWHDIHMHTLTSRYGSAPLDDEFIQALYLLIRNMTAQYIITNDISRVEKSEEMISGYIKKVVQELKEIDEEKKKDKRENTKDEERK
jgi:hypothetical protein